MGNAVDERVIFEPVERGGATQFRRRLDVERQTPSSHDPFDVVGPARVDVAVPGLVRRRPADDNALGGWSYHIVQYDRLVRVGDVFQHLETQHPVVAGQPELRQSQVHVPYDTPRRFLRERGPVVRVVPPYLLLTYS